VTFDQQSPTPKRKDSQKEQIPSKETKRGRSGEKLGPNQSLEICSKGSLVRNGRRAEKKRESAQRASKFEAKGTMEKEKLRG